MIDLDDNSADTTRLIAKAPDGGLNRSPNFDVFERAADADIICAYDVTTEKLVNCLYGEERLLDFHPRPGGETHGNSLDKSLALNVLIVALDDDTDEYTQLERIIGMVKDGVE